MADSVAQSPAAETSLLHLLPVTSIEPDPDQPRKHFDPDALRNLADSLLAEGQIQPIAVRQVAPDRYRIIAGERRWRAHQLAGLPTIRAEIRADMDASTIAVLQIVENLQREDLSLRETIAGCAALVKLLGFAPAVQRLGMSEAWVSRRSSLAEIKTPGLAALIETGKLQDVEVAHIAEQIYALDERDGLHFVACIADKDGYNGSMTRERARTALKEAKESEKRRREREAHEAKRKKLEEQEAARKAALKERAKAEAQAKAKGEKLPAVQLPLVPPPPKNETSWDRERRERAEKWVSIEPDMKRLARESKKAIATALAETLGKAGKDFEFHLGMPDNFQAYEPPANVNAGSYKLEVKGRSHDAGLLMDALAPTHEIGIQLSVTIGVLRQVEAITGKQYLFREYLQVKGGKAAAAAASVREIHAKRMAENLAKQGAAAQDKDGKPVDTITGINRFLSQKTRRKPHNRVKAADFHAAYLTYCGASGIGAIAPLNSNEWGSAIEQHGVKKIRSNGIQYTDIEVIA